MWITQLGMIGGLKVHRWSNHGLDGDIEMSGTTDLAFRHGTQAQGRVFMSVFVVQVIIIFREATYLTVTEAQPHHSDYRGLGSVPNHTVPQP